MSLSFRLFTAVCPSAEHSRAARGALSCHKIALLAALLLPLGLSPAGAVGEDNEDKKEIHPLDGLELRNIGPVNMSGRVADVEGIAGDPRTLYVGSASGGIWKTVNGGVTFEPIFDHQGIQSIGDMALAPSNPEVIYVGTGEGNPRNSVSFGRGVFKTTDGGQTWHFLGLKDTRYITRIAVHPRDPDTAWVGALGSIYGAGEQRGVFKTTDGGKSWRKVLYIDEHHGVADLDVDANNPNVLFAAMWRFERRPWTHRSGSREGGVFRSVDGGETWKKLEEGLPELLGRIGVKVAPSDPRVVYVIAESDEGTLFRSEDRGDTFTKVHDEARIVSRGLYYTDLRVDPTDANKVFAISSRLFRSIDGGVTFERISAATHVDYHSLWVDPTDPKRIWQGQDGGVAVSYDGGEHWDAPRNLPLAQFYQGFFDRRQPFYAVGGGLQDNGTWVGPSRTREPAGILPDDWRLTSFGDAYFVVPHPEHVGLYLSEYQGGGIVRYDENTRQVVEVNPQTRRADGGPVSQLEYRFNWNAPIIQSPHRADTVYFAGNVVFQSRDFGTTWDAISPDLTTDDPEKQKAAGGPVWIENTTAEYHCTIISLAESPVQAGLIWAGTDDGKLQVTHDGGESWADLSAGLPVPEHSPVSHIEPSRVDAAIAYASFDRHMFNDFAPHIFKTTDGGQTWSRLSEGLPEEGWVWVVREDPRNPEVLYAGTETGLYGSFNSGRSWQPLSFGDLPPVSVHDVLIQPDANDLIVATHGRGLWLLDDLTPVQDWAAVKKEAEQEGPKLFDPRPAMRFPMDPSRYGVGDRVWIAENPAYGALISYYLPEDLEPQSEADSDPSESGNQNTEGEVAERQSKESDEKEPPLRIEIIDIDGSVVRTLDDLPTGAGVQRVVWDLSFDGPLQRRESEELGDFDSAPRGPEALPGVYGVRLTVGDRVTQVSLEVQVDPLLGVSEADLKAQHQAAARLTGLQSRVNSMLKQIDTSVAELKARRESLKRHDREPGAALLESWEAVDEALTEQLDRLVRPEGKPFWSEGPRLSNHLSSLFGNLDSAFAAPTRAQLSFLDELEAQVAEEENHWQQLLGGRLATLAGVMAVEGFGPLWLPTAESSKATD